jgi:hypothetical protein
MYNFVFVAQNNGVLRANARTFVDLLLKNVFVRENTNVMFAVRKMGNVKVCTIGKATTCSIRKSVNHSKILILQFRVLRVGKHSAPARKAANV